MKQETADAMLSDLIQYGSTMKVIKRNGKEIPFDASKIVNAIRKANDEFEDEDQRMTDTQIFLVAEEVTKKFKAQKHPPNIEEIQNQVIRGIMKQGAYDVADAYSVYRYKRALSRQGNSTDDVILSLIDYENEDVKQENSNKNPRLASTQRDYMAGEVSKDITMRLLLPQDIVEAHEAGLIHFHDADYFAQKIYNCCLINLKDVLANGTVITDTMIESPKSFSTACNITTQIVAQVASSQYGGQTFSIAHLVPFVDISRQKWRKRLRQDMQECESVSYTEEQINEIAEKRVREEVKSGIQLIQYQLLTLMTTNGQTPFVSMFIYFGEVPEGPMRDDMAMVVKEVLEQRIMGIKNEKGVYVTPAFPKLLYVLDEDNVYPGSRYYDMTKLACQCTAKRLVPDYISAKQMRRLKKGDVYPCMGCVDGESVIDYRIKGERYVESFERAWGRMSMLYNVKTQPNGKDHYIDTPDVDIWDSEKKAYVKQERIIRNTQSEWYKVGFTGGRYLDVTNNHPFEVIGKGVVLADDLQIGDSVKRKNASEVKSHGKEKFDCKMWLMGLMLCDGDYNRQMNITLGLDETDILEKAKETVEKTFGYEAEINERHRGKKGNYYELSVKNAKALQKTCLLEFEGERKSKRHIPGRVFRASYEQKMSFMAGMIDADGYINSEGNTIRVQLGSTNEELALQQMALANDIGINAVIYPNHYKKGSGKIRYRVEFNCTEELAKYVVSGKKTEHYDKNHIFYTNTESSKDTCCVKSITPYYETKYSYDVTTESEHFTVNEIYSHNCRSFLTPDRFTDAGMGNMSRALDYDYENPEHRYYGRFNQGKLVKPCPLSA